MVPTSLLRTQPVLIWQQNQPSVPCALFLGPCQAVLCQGSADGPAPCIPSCPSPCDVCTCHHCGLLPGTAPVPGCPQRRWGGEEPPPACVGQIPRLSVFSYALVTRICPSIGNLIWHILIMCHPGWCQSDTLVPWCCQCADPWGRGGGASGTGLHSVVRQFHPVGWGVHSHARPPAPNLLIPSAPVCEVVWSCWSPNCPIPTWLGGLPPPSQQLSQHWTAKY